MEQTCRVGSFVPQAVLALLLAREDVVFL
jgi:hypothetical protein